MEQSKQDLINKVETLVGYLEYENKTKLDKKLYEGIVEECNEWLKELKEKEVTLIND